MQQFFIDVHAHLDDEAFDTTREQILADLQQNGVQLLINCGSDLPSSKNSLQLATQHSSIYCVLGCHPHEAKTYDKNFEEFLINNANHAKTVAIGEIGLDYHYDFSPREIQRQVFAQQIKLAHTLNLPIVIHTREAWGDTLEILKQNKQYLTNGVLFHCYNGSAEVTKLLTKEYDAYFSLGGAITFKNFNGFDTISAMPIERILTETDCPYMTPVPFRGKPNTPQNVALVAQKLSQQLDLPLQTLCETLKENTLRFFKKIKPF